MSSCNTKSGIRTRTNQDKSTRTSTKIKGVSCSCGQLCKNFRGPKLYQIKANCQASENKLTGPDKRCFVSLTDILNTSFLKFGDTIYSKTPSNTSVPICNFDKPISATQCFVKTNDIVIDPIPEYFNDNISPCDSKACLTCNSFISDQSFESILTGRIYKTQTYEQLTCGSSNVVYAIHCIRCGLMYVDETGRSLRSRTNGHRAGIIKDGQSLLYKHFRLPGHSVADMKVQILEKIYHSSENQVNIRLHRGLRELYWIKELGTAAPYGCNDQIKEVGTLNSPSCKDTNVLGIFNKQQRRKRSHGHRNYNKKTPQIDSGIDTFIDLIDSIDQPQGVHKIKTTLFSISLPKLRELQSLALESTNYDYESAEYNVAAIILDTAQYRLLRPVRSVF